MHYLISISLKLNKIFICFNFKTVLKMFFYFFLIVKKEKNGFFFTLKVFSKIKIKIKCPAKIKSSLHKSSKNSTKVTL